MAGDPVQLDGMDLMGRGYADAVLTNSTIVDVGPGPFDLESSHASKQSALMEEVSSDHVTIYLIGVLSWLGLQCCLWLRLLAGPKMNFKRIGFF